jgi:4-hydroxybenzoate polyprenyltransferase
VLAALIVYYDILHKANPFAPFVMGLCRVGAYTTAALAGGAELCPDLWIGCGLLLAYLIGLSFVARQENLARVTNLWPLVFLAVPLAVLHPYGQGPWTFAIYLMFAGWTVRCVRLVMRGHTRDAVGGLIAGISLLDALFVIRADPTQSGQLALAGIACGGFLLTTVLQRRIAGT